jgi:hypothetical protein
MFDKQAAADDLQQLAQQTTGTSQSSSNLLLNATLFEQTSVD